jgi:hypothetical protein
MYTALVDKARPHQISLESASASGPDPEANYNCNWYDHTSASQFQPATHYYLSLHSIPPSHFLAHLHNTSSRQSLPPIWPRTQEEGR